MGRLMSAEARGRRPNRETELKSPSQDLGALASDMVSLIRHKGGDAVRYLARARLECQ